MPLSVDVHPWSPPDAVQSQSLSLETAPEGGVLHSLSVCPLSFMYWSLLELGSPSLCPQCSLWKRPLCPLWKDLMTGDTSGLWANLPFSFAYGASFSQVLCPKNEKLKNWRNQVLFHWQSLKLPSSYHWSTFPTICMRLPQCTTYTPDDIVGHLHDIKWEHHFWNLPRLNSHGSVGEGFRDFTLTFWLNANLANSTPFLGCCSASILFHPGWGHCLCD